jgi:tetratricopeptide (TPR) repeat protein
MVGEKSSPGMLTGGTIERTSLSEAFRNVVRDRLSGKLVVASKGEERTFWFHRGQVGFASSNREAQLVGELLRTFGLAEESLLLSAFEKAMAEPGYGLSKALAASGAVSSFVAEAASRALAERVLYDAFRLSSGIFTISPGEPPPELPFRFDRSTGSLALEALRRLPSGRTLTGFSVVEPRSRPLLHPDLILRYQVVTLSPEEGEALSRVDGVRTAEQVSSETRVLARLAAVGLIQIVPAARSIEPSAAPTGLASLNVEISGVPPPPRLSEILENQARIIVNAYRRLDWSTYYDLLGIDRSAGAEEIQRAVHERARLFHPDNHLKPVLAGHWDALEALFQKLRTVERALRTKESRASYDQTLDQGGHESMRLPDERPTAALQKQIAKANYQRAKVLYDEEDYYPAYEMVRQAIEFDPKEREYWILLSRIQRKNPKWLRQSSETIRRALQNIPDNLELWWELAEAFKAERNPGERIKALREVMKLDPRSRRAQSALSELGADKEG